MTTQEGIFINTFLDLKERLDKLTEYDLLRASGLIRQLIVDSNSVVEQVNRNYRIKIRYRVTQRFDPPTARIRPDGKVLNAWIGVTFIFPGTEGKSFEFLTKDEFLKYELLHYTDYNFNVLDIVRICAHKYGGVHLSKITDKRDQALHIASEGFYFNDSPNVYHCVYGIGKVCIEALELLKDEIIEKYKS